MTSAFCAIHKNGSLHGAREHKISHVDHSSSSSGGDADAYSGCGRTPKPTGLDCSALTRVATFENGPWNVGAETSTTSPIESSQ